MRELRVTNLSAAAYVHADHLGSPIVANRGAARQIWREEYTPHGEPRLSPAANDNDQGFTGHIADTDTGLAYMQARYYDPVIGRFLSPDPVGFASGGLAYFNRYAYVANDPVNNTDPTGEFCVPCAGFVVGVALDVVIQSIENGGFKNIDAGQALRAGAIGAVGGGLTSAGKILVSQAANAGVKTGTVSAVNAARNTTIGGVAALAEAINSGAENPLQAAAVDMATAKIGGEIFDAIEGGDSVAREVGEAVSGVAADIGRAADQVTEPRGLVVDITEGTCANPSNCERN